MHSQPALQPTRGDATHCIWEPKTTSQSAPANSLKSKALSILPLPQSVLSLPFPASSRVNKRHIYSAWLWSEVEQEVLAAWQPKGEAVPALKRKHLKTFRGCSVKKTELCGIKQPPITEMTTSPNTTSSGGGAGGKSCAIYVHSQCGVYQW